MAVAPSTVTSYVPALTGAVNPALLRITTLALSVSLNVDAYLIAGRPVLFNSMMISPPVTSTFSGFAADSTDMNQHIFSVNRAWEPPAFQLNGKLAIGAYGAGVVDERHLDFDIGASLGAGWINHRDACCFRPRLLGVESAQREHDGEDAHRHHEGQAERFT